MRIQFILNELDNNFAIYNFLLFNNFSMLINGFFY